MFLASLVFSLSDSAFVADWKWTCKLLVYTEYNERESYLF